MSRRSRPEPAIDNLAPGYIVIGMRRFRYSATRDRNRRPRIGEVCLLIVAFAALVPFTVEAQSRSETAGDCGVAICLQTGISNWRYEATQYCEAEV